MLSAFLIKPKDIELQEVDIPRPSRGEVLIKIKVALTCGTDLKAFLRGHPMIPMPGVFGHEFSGVIVEAGKGVSGFKTGDEVMTVHTAPCLKCRYCKRKFYNLCEDIMDRKALGAFAEYIVLPAHIVKQNLFWKPLNLSFKEAAFLEPLSCVVHGMDGLNIREGDRVLIIGIGPIGLLHLLLTKLKGAKVMMVGLKEDRLKLARKLGADLAVTPSGLIKAVKDFTEKVGFDFLFECTGQLDVWESSADYVRRGGTVILFGGCKKGTKVTYDTYRLHYDEIILKGVFHFTPKDVREAYRLLKDRRIDVSTLVTKDYPLKEIEMVFEKLANAEGVKYAIVP